MDINNIENENLDIKVAKILHTDVLEEGGKVAEADVFYDEDGKRVRQITYIDMNDNRRYDLISSVSEYKNGVIYKHSVIKVKQIVRYNHDGSIRNVTNFS